MRLLNVNTLEFTKFHIDQRPKYVTASHRWTDGSEASFKDVRKRRNIDSAGYQKVGAFARYVKQSVPWLEWLWIDTCCINQEDAAELSEAVNLMFSWYRNAEMCIAYLADVDSVEDEHGFVQSEWFQRGWTLQELLAPRTVTFVTKQWQIIGNKSDLAKQIAATTGIPERVLRDYDSIAGTSIDEKLRWMEGRRATRDEDLSYALYGIFGVTPGANYGEGRDGARQRLLSAIRQKQDLVDQHTTRFTKLAAWISPPDPWTNHQSARQRHEPRTGTWLLHSVPYQSWKSGSVRHLWVHGKCGCGKTILCSTAIEDIREHCRSERSAGLAAFYFSFSDKQKQTYDNLLRSLVVQFGWKEPGLSMLRQTHSRPAQSMPSLDELEAIVVSSINSLDEAFVLLDALDECPEESEVRREVLECLERLSHQAPKLRLLVTSREVADVGDSMEMLGAASIHVQSASVDADIRQYMATQLSTDRRLNRLNSTTKTLIEETITRSADGMFRWAYCQLQELRSLPSMKPKYVKATLNALPLTLDATYERMLMAIRPMFRQDALTLLRWLAYAQSPPSLVELVDAAIIDLEGEGHVEDSERGGLEDTLDILSGLVVVQGAGMDDCENSDNHRHEHNERHRDEDDATDDSNDELTGSEIHFGDPLARSDSGNRISYRSQWIGKHTKVRLAHVSVKDYLESSRILASSAKDFHLDPLKEHRFLAQSCLIYLTHYSGSAHKQSNRKDLAEFPLLLYAARSWSYHSSLQERGSVVREISLLSTKTCKRDWLLVHNPDFGLSQPFKGFPPTIGSPLYYASLFGLEEVVKALLKAGADVNARGGGLLRTALHVASCGGHERVVRVLLDAGADVNAWVKTWDWEMVYGSALEAASIEGHEKVVKILIDAGAEVNARRSNVLARASWYGHERVVQVLLDSGADVNARDEQYGSALQAAALGDAPRVARILLAAGADVNAQGGRYHTALRVAAGNGHEMMARMLIDAGANVDIHSGFFANALNAT